MTQAFPDAHVYSILGRPAVVERMGIGNRAHWVLPARERVLSHYRLSAPLLPALVDNVRLPEADVLISSSYGFAHRFRTTNDAPHVCFCHSPLRFAWSMTDSYRRELSRGRPTSFAFRALAASMRRSDRAAAERPSKYLTTGAHVAGQIEEFYGRTAEVIGAPIDCSLFRPVQHPDEIEDYALFCGRLVEPYKRAAITIEAFRRLGRPLKVVGDGPALAGLRASAPANVEFVGALQDEDLVRVMQRARWAIFPSKDDLGLIPLEVMACGRPVLAYGGGGALDTIVPGVTGDFFFEQTPAAIVAAVEAFDPDRFDPVVLRTHACAWDRTKFRGRLVASVSEVLQA